MQVEDRLAIKSVLFAFMFPVVWFGMRSVVSPAVAAAIAGAVTIGLFHWLPPRIHQGLTPAKSAALILASTIVAGLAVLLIERMFGPLPN